MAKVTNQHLDSTSLHWLILRGMTVRSMARAFQFVTMAMLWVLLGAGILHGQQSNPTEYQVKAAYLYNFAKFVQWPTQATTNDVFTICVLGQDPFGATFEAIAGQSMNGKKVVIERMTKPHEALGCRILFISLSEEKRLKEILATLNQTSILTVSDMPHFTGRGGMIQFVMAANKVRFEVNLRSAERTGLTLSSQLLRVALTVTTGS